MRLKRSRACNKRAHRNTEPSAMKYDNQFCLWKARHRSALTLEECEMSDE